jgi:hypothetical protein
MGLPCTPTTSNPQSLISGGQPWLTIGVLAAFIPFAGYVTAFLYELGFVSHFKIPVQFITLDWTTVLIAGVVVFGILFLVLLAVNLISPSFLPIKNAVRVALFRTIMSAVAVIPMALLVQGWFRVVVLAIPLFWAFIEFAFPYIVYRGKGTYMERLELAQRKYPSRDHSLVGRIPNRVFWLLVLLLWISWLAFSMGLSSASRQKEFLVVNTSPEAVVLRPYHDHLVCAYFDRESREVDRSFFVLDTASGSEIILTREQVGPLRVKGD